MLDLELARRPAGAVRCPTSAWPSSITIVAIVAGIAPLQPREEQPLGAGIDAAR